MVGWVSGWGEREGGGAEGKERERMVGWVGGERERERGGADGKERERMVGWVGGGRGREREREGGRDVGVSAYMCDHASMHAYVYAYICMKEATLKQTACVTCNFQVFTPPLSSENNWLTCRQPLHTPM